MARRGPTLGRLERFLKEPNMSWSVDDIRSQRGRVAVVTGANGGLGLQTATVFAGKGGHVVMAARNQRKAASALARIERLHPGASLELVELDLGSLASLWPTRRRTWRATCSPAMWPVACPRC
jgi:hypothetical protein